MYIFSGDNPSNLYLQSLKKLVSDGKKLAPRGLSIKELRPVTFEFTNPLHRVTFLKGRNINPFFQLAESLWIISGCSDVEWISKFNSKISQFSDDGVFFNGPYGERLRSWNKSDYNRFVFNPLDQFLDVFHKLFQDRDSRQAVAMIYNPIFDNFGYKGKDIPCNLVLLFKIRENALDLTVLNRSNDIHWGLFGANLVQFSTIQEMMASWLDVPVGVYYHITDSLHVYLENYGSNITSKVMENYSDSVEEIPQGFYFPEEPRFLNMESIYISLDKYWEGFNSILFSDEFGNFSKSSDFSSFKPLFASSIPDPYILDTVMYITIYRLLTSENYEDCVDILLERPDSQWKVACTRFVYRKLKKLDSVLPEFESRISNQFSEKALEFIKGE